MYDRHVENLEWKFVTGKGKNLYCKWKEERDFLKNADYSGYINLKRFASFFT